MSTPDERQRQSALTRDMVLAIVDDMNTEELASVVSWMREALRLADAKIHRTTMLDQRMYAARFNE